METSEQLDQIASALAVAQSELRAVKQDSRNPHFKNKYTSLKAFIESCRPVLTKHGLSVIQAPYSGEQGSSVGVTTRLLHTSGQWLESSISVPSLGKPNHAQEAGSIITYLRRYSYTAIIGVAPGEEDDDGESLGHSPIPDDDKEQVTGGGDAAFALLRAAEEYVDRGDASLARQTLGARSGSAPGSAARIMSEAYHADTVGQDDFKRFGREWARIDRKLQKLEAQNV